ncbi:MAG TPA: CNP1-like family protein [Burkholderiales bacterium]|nr:CNP1-like family protein [Burkholderiales bacterium]
MRGLRAIALVAVAAGCAQSDQFSDELEGKSWEVEKAFLPSYPKGENLVPIYVGRALPFSFFVDRVSVTVGRDGVIRYTLVARSASEATNVSYEGIRCQTYEHRVYGFGRSDGTWAQARNSQWIPIGRLSVSPATSLADDLFCSERGRVRTTDEAQQALARGNRLR